MNDQISYEIALQPTGNDWDAPIARYRFEDGTMQLRRDEEEPDKKWVGRLWIAHGVVVVDGIMSEFDQGRQP